MYKMIKSVAKAGCALLLMVGVSACNQDKPKGESITTENHLDASNYAAWVYYSLKDNKIVKNRIEYPEDKLDKSWDPTKDNSWDIAFHRGELRVNDSHFGGKAAIATLDSKDFKASIKKSDLEWVTNEQAKIQIGFDMAAMRKGQNKSSYADALWVSKTLKENRIKYRTSLFNPENKPIPEIMGDYTKMYANNPYIMVVRAADGKTFYKVQWTGYLTAKGKGGGVSFKYQRVTIN